MSILNYDDVYQDSITNPEKLWNKYAQEVFWDKQYTSVLDNQDSPVSNWFTGGEINMSYNCLDKAVEEGYGNDVAVIYESPVTNVTQYITYLDLLKAVELFAGFMVQKCDMKKGDRVCIYLPVIPECLIAMLACTRIGIIYTIIFECTPIYQIISRINHIEPKLILTCNIAYDGKTELKLKENMDNALKESVFELKYCVIFNRPGMIPAMMIESRDLDWYKETSLCSPQKAIPLESNHPIFIIYTSGTTGEPKGLTLATGKLIVFYKFALKYLFDIKAREPYWMFSNFGWVTGQALMSYGPLLNRCKTLLYEGNVTNTPDQGELSRIMNKHKIVSFMASPTLMRILRKICSEKDLLITYDGLRHISLGGEICDSNLTEWISKSFKCPVYNVYGQTEHSGPIISPCLSFFRSDYKHSVLVPGFEGKIIDSKTGEECPIGVIGELILKTSKAPTAAITIYKNHERYIKTYYSKYPGYYDTHDYARILNDGSLEILSRSDDVIQVFSENYYAGELEGQCLKNDDLINVAIVSLKDEIYGQVPFAFLMKRNDHKHSDEEIIRKTIELIKINIGEYVFFNKAVIVPDFPNTLNHKISRQSLCDMINERKYKISPNVHNPEIYKTIYDILIKHGYKATMPINN